MKHTLLAIIGLILSIIFFCTTLHLFITANANTSTSLPNSRSPIQKIIHTSINATSEISTLYNNLSNTIRYRTTHRINLKLKAFVCCNFLRPAITTIRIKNFPKPDPIRKLDPFVLENFIKPALQNTIAAHNTPQPLLDIPLDTEIQNTIFDYVCQGNARDFCTLMAIADKETKYQYWITVAGGYYGMYGIHRSSNYSRIKELGVTDLLNPVQSSMVALDLIHDIMAELDTDTITHHVLMSYNQGSISANCSYKSGVHSTYYSRYVLSQAEYFMSVINLNP